MAGSDPTRDPKFQLREAIEQIRKARNDLRESVVQRVMRRNYLAEEAARLETLTADLEQKAARAEKLSNPELAQQIRQERDSRQAELERTRAMLAEAEAQAESAKIQMPEQEARLEQQARDLNAQFVQLAGAHIDASATGEGFTEADELWNRAADKMRTLSNEAAARGEVAGGGPAGAAPAPPRRSPEESAENMLAELESRLGMNAPAPAVPPKPPATVDAPLPAPTTPAALEPVPAPPVAPSSPATAPPAPSATISRETPQVAAAASGRTEIARAPQSLHITKGESSRMELTQRVRVAAIGTGNIFRGAHLPCYPKIAQAQLVAICDPDKTAQEMTHKRYKAVMQEEIEKAHERNDQEAVDRLQRDIDGIQICDDISEVIETIKPDLADICTQPLLHAPLSIQALEAGIHVMCEKPIARSWLETRRLIETVKRTGKMYQHNENWLWDPDYYTARKLIASGAIGEPILMFLATAHGGPEGNGKFWNPAFGGGGALLDNGIHAIGAAWFISGLDKKPTLVKAAEPFGMSIRMPKRIIDGRYQDVTVDDDAHILIRFENADTGAWSTAHVEGSWSHRDSPDTVIIGTTGKIAFRSEEGRRYVIVTDVNDRERRIDSSGPTWQPWPSSFYGEILNMVECVRNNAPTLSGPEFGAECSAVVGASYLSEKNGRVAVSVEEFKEFARSIAERFPNEPKAADDALVDALLSAVRKKK